METKYKPDNVVYVVMDYKVIKSVVDSTVSTTTLKGTEITYNVYSYYHQNEKRKIKSYNEAYLVDNLELAKQSALTNWERITKQVEQELTNLTDEMFEPKSMEKIQ